MPSFADFVDAFGSGLNVLGDSYRNRGVRGVAGDLYGAAGQNLRTGLGLGDTPEATAGALQNLGVNRNAALAIGGGANALADTFNPLGYVGGVAAAPTIARGVGALGRAAKGLTGGGQAAVSTPVPTSTPMNRLANLAAEARPPAAPLSTSLDEALARRVAADRVTGAVERSPIAGDEFAAKQLGRLRASPDFPSIMQQVPPGQKALGAGAQAVAFGDPETVTRLGLGRGSQPPSLRPAIQGLVQPERSQVIGNTLVETGLPRGQVGQFGDPVAEQMANTLYNRYAAQGLKPIRDEFRPDNIAQFGNDWRLIDPGMFKPQ